MPSDRINVGDEVELTGTIKRRTNGSLIDPTTVTVALTSPSGVTVTLTPTHLSTGVYQATHVVDEPGLWHWSMTGTGTAPSAEASNFEVFPA